MTREDVVELSVVLVRERCAIACSTMTPDFCAFRIAVRHVDLNPAQISSSGLVSSSSNVFFGCTVNPRPSTSVPARGRSRNSRCRQPSGPNAKSTNAATATRLEISSRRLNPRYPVAQPWKRLPIIRTPTA